MSTKKTAKKKTADNLSLHEAVALLLTEYVEDAEEVTRQLHLKFPTERALSDHLIMFAECQSNMQMTKIPGVLN